ncbi:MAG: DUF1460 domain-containing protein [Candidatus Kapabacteria bacterium]|nr:DUF1460 domain-containing protein [Candidatus Kapabacteria bacterium]
MMVRTIVALLFMLALFPCASVHAQDADLRRRVQTLSAIAKDSAWASLPLGQLMAKLGRQLVGTPYVGGTLEGEGPEVCRVRLDGLDCVTFFESVLNLSRNLQNGHVTADKLVESVMRTRYRSGKIAGYTSRLHYTTDWILDNVRKGIVTDISKDLGGKPVHMPVDFMSTNPKYYPALRQDSDAVRQMAEIEARLRGETMFVIGRKDIADIESRLQDGDIVAIVTSKKGLDYAHTGIVVREGNRARFMHASSTKKHVVLDGYLSDVIARVDTWTGISVARPLPAR